MQTNSGTMWEYILGVNTGGRDYLRGWLAPVETLCDDVLLAISFQVHI